MTHDELIGYVQAHKEGKLQKRNIGGDWFTLEGDCDDLLLALRNPFHLRLAPEPVPPGDLTWEEAKELHDNGIEIEFMVIGDESPKWGTCGRVQQNGWFHPEHSRDYDFQRSCALRRKPAPKMVPLPAEAFIPGTVLRDQTGADWLVTYRWGGDLSLVYNNPETGRVEGCYVTPRRLFDQGWQRTTDSGKTWHRCERPEEAKP